jgi:hypothetical protein
VIPYVDASTFGQAVVKTTLLQVLHEHPGWLLRDLGDYFERGGPLANELGAITVAELMALHELPPVDPHRAGRERAEQLHGPEFDAVVLEIIRDAGNWVKAAYVRERVGDPRWKRQAAIRRLIKTGAIEREGRSSNARYRVRPQPGGSKSR